MNMPFTDEQIQIKMLDHLGLVAATIDRLGLIKKIDEYLPLTPNKGAKVTIGQRVAAMILNGLGFMDSRLYVFSDFLENKPVSQLLGEGLKAEDFTDDCLGRALDKIDEYGVTHLFSQLAFSIGVEHQLLGQSAHFDTSTLSVYGAYESEDTTKTPEGEKEGAQLGYGYSKDHRPDLKQMVLNLATTGASGFPIWMENHSGNSSDKKILKEAAKRMKRFCEELKAAPSFLYVADSAMYESCLKDGGDLLWLSRVPERLKEAKQLIQQPEEAFEWQSLEKGYRYCVIETTYKNIPQRWCVVSSEAAYKREEKTLNKQIEKEQAALEKALWHLSCEVFACEKDAEKAIKKRFAKTKYHHIITALKPLEKHNGRGRPAKDALKNITGYQVQGKIIKDEEAIENYRRQKGRFILATNECDREKLPDSQLLGEYKEQSKTERGFKFIKDDTFQVDSIFLKKTARIRALMMVMTLCLMVHSFAQYHLREALKKAEAHVPNERKKPTATPSIKHVFKLFTGVCVLKITLEKEIQTLVVNLNDLLKRIVSYFGLTAQRIYGLTGDG